MIDQNPAAPVELEGIQQLEDARLTSSEADESIESVTSARSTTLESAGSFSFILSDLELVGSNIVRCNVCFPKILSKLQQFSPARHSEIEIRNV